MLIVSYGGFDFEIPSYLINLLLNLVTDTLAEANSFQGYSPLLWLCHVLVSDLYN